MFILYFFWFEIATKLSYCNRITNLILLKVINWDIFFEKAQKTIYISNSIIENKLKVYPNPSSNYTTVEINITEGSLGQLIIYNMLGGKIFEQKIDKSDILTIETNNYSDGIYMVVLLSDKEILEKQKLIILK